MNVYKLALFLALACCTFPLMAGPEPETNEPAVEVEVAVEAEVAAEAAAEKGAPETLRHKDRAESIMDVPLDGSSVEAFTARLKVVDEEATEEEYRALMSALDFLLFYDIGARRNKERLYSRLDGDSPNDILETVASYRKSKNK
jgi:hypothetical protein